MSKLVKIAGGVIALVIVAVIVIAVVLSSILGSAVKQGVESVGPEMTQSSVTLGSTSLSPWSGSGTLKNFNVGNPEGYKADSAFEFGEVSLEVDPGSLTSDVVVIKKILIDKAQITWEGSLKGSNLSKLQKNIEEFTGPAETAPEGEAPAEEAAGEEMKIVIKDFLLTGTKVRVGIGDASKTVELPEIHLTDIGDKSSGTTIKEAITQIIRPVTRATAETVAKNQVELGVDKEGALGGVTDKVKGLFGR